LLFDFRFFVQNVLAGHRIEFFEFELVRRALLIFVCGVEMTGASAGDQFDFVTHVYAPSSLERLDLFAVGAKISQHRVDAVFVDGAHRSSRYAQTHEAVFRCNPETVPLQIRQIATLGFVVSVGNIVSYDWALTRDLANSSHGQPRFQSLNTGADINPATAEAMSFVLEQARPAPKRARL
jgi:hypothetical protein